MQLYSNLRKSTRPNETLALGAKLRAGVLLGTKKKGEHQVQELNVASEKKEISNLAKLDTNERMTVGCHRETTAASARPSSGANRVEALGCWDRPKGLCYFQKLHTCRTGAREVGESHGLALC